MHLGNYYISWLLLKYFSFSSHWAHSFSENHELTSPFTLTTAHSSDFCSKRSMASKAEGFVDDVGHNPMKANMS